MKRLLFLLVLVAGVGYYVNQAALVPGWVPYPLPDWVPAWARFAPPTGAAGQPQGRRRGGAGGGGGGGRSARGNADGPVPVVATESKYADVPVTVDAVGTVQALNTVTVRTQVDGKLIELDFKDGQDVKKGDVLARIDPAIYQAQYDQTVATKAKDEATLANARNDLLRYQRLAQTEAGSKQQADTQKALVAQLEAQVKGDQAAADNAKATLAYTTILAPIDGRTGIRLVDQGNILRASDTTGIVVITQLKPINVIFNLPQQQLRPVNSAMGKGAVDINALQADNSTIIDKGTIQVIDNQVDPTTGTVKMKSIFPNDQTQLWPGQFVNVRLFVDVLKHAVVVPTAAVQRGPNGAYVYVLTDNSKAALRTVVVGQQNESQAVITSGIQPPERVVTTGFARLTDGAKVTTATPASQADEATPARPGSGQPKRGAGSSGAAAAPTDASQAPDVPPAGAPPASGPTRGAGGGHRRHPRGGAESPAAPAPSPNGAAAPSQ